jgi:hypothetical protein
MPTEQSCGLQDLDISPLHKYRHPIIQTVVNVTWFQSNDDDGIVFREYFTPISVELIGLALTVVRIKGTCAYP